jgi:predicted nucleotide-binding protein (sugar kinase/HSP70/actin superfamily)
VRLGFPRALFFYDHYPFWFGFFQTLGIQLVLSPPTCKRILEEGLKKANDGVCLPLKLLAGHIAAFRQIEVDAIFLPRMVSVEAGTYLCPKMLGVPESVAALVPSGLPVLSATVNWRDGRGAAEKALLDLGRRLGKPKKAVREAWEAGMACERAVRERQRQAAGAAEYFVWLGQEDKRPEDRARLPALIGAKPLRIALLGHSYLIHDAYANLQVWEKLSAKAEVRVAENVSGAEIEQAVAGMHKKIFWSHGKRIFGAGRSFIDEEEIDGLIYLSCFGCGTDSMVQDMLARAAREKRKPYMMITLDEHSGEAGLATRLEAFIDMLERRKRSEDHLSAPGKRLDRHSGVI